jgi:repressor LexA
LTFAFSSLLLFFILNFKLHIRQRRINFSFFIAMFLTKRQRDIYNAIRRFIKKHGYSPSLEEICSDVGLSSLATVHKHLKNLEHKGIISRKWNRGRSIEITAMMDLPGTLDLPLLGEIISGKPIQAPEINRSITVPLDLLRGRETFVLQVKGDSLRDEYLRNSDYLIVERRNTPESGELVVAQLQDQEIIVRRFFPEQDYFRLQSENPQKSPLLVPENNLLIRGVVIGVLRWYD